MRPRSSAPTCSVSSRVTSLSSFAAYFWQGLFTGDVGALFLPMAPLYGVALILGARLFRHTDGAAYRPFAYVVIAVAAVTSAPLFDGIFG